MLLRLAYALGVLLCGSGRGEDRRHVLVFEERTKGVALSIHHSTEINELYVAVIMQKNVVRLQIAIHQPHLMKMDESQRNFRRIKFHSLDGETAIVLPQSLIQVASYLQYMKINRV